MGCFEAILKLRTAKYSPWPAMNAVQTANSLTKDIQALDLSCTLITLISPQNCEITYTKSVIFGCARVFFKTSVKRLVDKQGF